MEQLCSCTHKDVDIFLYQKVDESDTCYPISKAVQKSSFQIQ
jgi:hypothetical protein